MEKGFSLFELLVVISIVAILSAIALPNYVSWRNRAILDSATFNLRADLQRAKLEAMKQKNSVRVDFSASGYKAFIDSNTNNKIDEGELVFTRDLEGVAVNMSDTAFGKFKYTKFNSRGMAPGFFGHVSVISGNSTRTVVVDRVGRVRMS